MGHADFTGLTLQINCAACHGLLTWAEREGLLQKKRLVTQLKASPSDQRTNKEETLLAVTLWALECLGVSKASHDFWLGWSGGPEKKLSRDWQLGHLCRTAPSLLREASKDRAPVRQAAMYHCYEYLLLHPDQNRLDGVDGYVDDRSEDIKLSELVYHHNFKQPLNELINQIVATHTGQEPLTIIDIGAGSGGMLLDVAKSLRLTTKNVNFVAIDPSNVARRACRKTAILNPEIKMHVAAGSIENPTEIIQTLKEKSIPNEHCIVLAKAALHDRTLGSMFPTENEREEVNEEPQGKQDNEYNYVYRDENWKQVRKHQVMYDMVIVLNAWKRALPDVRLIILESHIIPARTINEQINRIALLPAYLSHSLSAQYMLSGSDHHKATQQARFKKNKFIPLQVMPDQNPLMSITFLED